MLKVSVEISAFDGEDEPKEKGTLKLLGHKTPGFVVLAGVGGQTVVVKADELESAAKKLSA